MQRRLTTSERRLLAVIFVVPFTLLLAGIIGRVVYLQARHHCCSSYRELLACSPSVREAVQ